MTKDDDSDTEPAEGEIVKSAFGIERDKRVALEAMPGFQLEVDLEALSRDAGLAAKPVCSSRESHSAAIYARRVLRCLYYVFAISQRATV
jgi:hypothetical protein